MEAPAEDVAAKAFLEDLLRRGRLKLENTDQGNGSAGSGFTGQNGHDRHTHELRKEGKDLILKRLRIDCCFKME
jgi:oxalate decarboxylase/phosphoglucose isomerase-like protein (cupin superfamily)